MKKAIVDCLCILLALSSIALGIALLGAGRTDWQFPVIIGGIGLAIQFLIFGDKKNAK